MCTLLQVCTCIYTRACVHMCVRGMGCGRKALSFLWKIILLIRSAYHRRLLNIIDLDCLPGVSYTLMFVKMPAGFNQSRQPEVRGLPFSGGAQIPRGTIACQLRLLPPHWNGWFVFGQHGWWWALRVWCKVDHIGGSIVLGSLEDNSCP